MGSISSRHYTIIYDSEHITGLMNNHESRVSWLARHPRNCGDAKKAGILDLRVTYDEGLFKNGRIIGRGGFGEVRLNQSAFNEKFYAVKTIRKQLIWEKQCAEDVATEVAILSRLSHPFVVHLFGVFQDASRVCLVLQFCVGGELFSLLAKHPKGRFSHHEAKFYAAEIAHALQYLHSQKIIYRDLKPENCLLDEQGHVVLTDFGLAHQFQDTPLKMGRKRPRPRKEDSRDSSSKSSSWGMQQNKEEPDTAVGTCGTAMYLAPEMVRGMRDHFHGYPVDWWALGAVLYEMLEGKPPFGDTHDVPKFEVFNNILEKKVKYSRRVSKAAKSLVDGLLQKDQAYRAGWNEVKSHKWLAEIQWDAVNERRMKPPWKPIIRTKGDCRYFLNWDSKPETECQMIMNVEQETYCNIEVPSEFIISKEPRNGGINWKTALHTVSAYHTLKARGGNAKSRRAQNSEQRPPRNIRSSPGRVLSHKSIPSTRIKSVNERIRKPPPRIAVASSVGQH